MVLHLVKQIYKNERKSFSQFEFQYVLVLLLVLPKKLILFWAFAAIFIILIANILLYIVFSSPARRSRNIAGVTYILERYNPY